MNGPLCGSKVRVQEENVQHLSMDGNFVIIVGLQKWFGRGHPHPLYCLFTSFKVCCGSMRDVL